MYNTYYEYNHYIFATFYTIPITERVCTYVTYSYVHFTSANIIKIRVKINKNSQDEYRKGRKLVYWELLVSLVIK